MGEEEKPTGSWADVSDAGVISPVRVGGSDNDLPSLLYLGPAPHVYRMHGDSKPAGCLLLTPAPQPAESRAGESRVRAQGRAAAGLLGPWHPLHMVSLSGRPALGSPGAAGA